MPLKFLKSDVRVRVSEGAFELPVGGGTRVEDVLLGREQRQAVGIKVNGSLVHDATPLKYKNKNFPQRALALLSKVVPMFERGSEFLQKGVEELESERKRERNTLGVQVHEGAAASNDPKRERAPCVEETVRTAHWALCALVE